MERSRRFLLTETAIPAGVCRCNCQLSAIYHIAAKCVLLQFHKRKRAFVQGTSSLIRIDCVYCNAKRLDPQLKIT